MRGRKKKGQDEPIQVSVVFCTASTMLLYMIGQILNKVVHGEYGPFWIDCHLVKALQRQKFGTTMVSVLRKLFWNLFIFERMETGVKAS